MHVLRPTIVYSVARNVIQRDVASLRFRIISAAGSSPIVARARTSKVFPRPIELLGAFCSVRIAGSMVASRAVIRTPKHEYTASDPSL